MEVEPTSLGRVGVEPFEECFRALFADVGRTAGLIARNATLGPDIAQEAFARLYERWDRIESEEHARNFVYRVAVNLARSHLRRRVAMPFGLRGPGDHRVDSTDDWLTIRAALGHLSSRQRTCVVLVDYADLDTDEVSALLGLAEGTVRVHLSRGRRALRQHLSIPQEDP